jgi:hypothetical protein
MDKTQPYTQILADIYDMDPFHANYNYKENTTRIMALLGDMQDKTMLELASGTGSYLYQFSNYSQRVVGLELSSYMRAISLQKFPDLPVYLGDMADFHLAERFDVIALLCGTIAALVQDTETTTLDKMRKMISCCRTHIKSHGVVIIETYDQPNTVTEWVLSSEYNLEEKYVSHHAVKTKKDSRFITLHEHFLITPKNPSGKTEYVQEKYNSYLCSSEELITLFAEQGFSVKEHIPSFAMKGRDLIIFETYFQQKI